MIFSKKNRYKFSEMHVEREMLFYIIFFELMATLHPSPVHPSKINDYTLAIQDIIQHLDLNHDQKLV